MLRPHGKRLILKQVEVDKIQKGILLPDSAKKQNKEYIVQSTHSESEIKEGDKVMIKDYSSTNVECPETGENLTIVQEEDILAVF